FIVKYYKTNPTFLTYGGINLPKDKNKSLNKEKSKIINSHNVLFIGRLEKDTGFLSYIKALKILKTKYNRRITMIVCGDGNLKSIAKKYVKTYNLSVEFKGFVSDLDKYYGESDIILSSSYLSILEALYKRKIVISTYQNKLKNDYLKLSPFSKYIFICENPHKIAHIIDDIHRNKRKYSIQSEAGEKFAKKRTWDETYKLYKDLWKINANKALYVSEE
ncbi:MAG: glycosyltransferase, partial [Candidatus Lokiarchaeota archaeon]|nr:glycosyltransferase [Candidatus Lokiarchaeota archaeon]